MSEILSESEFSKAIEKFKKIATPEAEKLVKTLEDWRRKEIIYTNRIRKSGGELRTNRVKAVKQRRVDRLKDIKMLRKEAGKLKSGFLTKVNNTRKRLGLKKIATVSGVLAALGIGAAYFKKYRDKKQEEKNESFYESWGSNMNISEQFILEKETEKEREKREREKNKYTQAGMGGGVGMSLAKSIINRRSAASSVAHAAVGGVVGGAIGHGIDVLRIRKERKKCQEIKNSKQREECLKKWGAKQ